MFAQLGSTILQGLFSWHEFEREGETRFAELELINSKPDLQKTGIALDVITFGIRFHSSFCNPVLRYGELDTYRINAEVLPLLDGYGNLKGNFVIEKLKQNVLQEDTRGAVIYCECTVTLKEYVDPDKTISQSTQAQANAFALDVKSIGVSAIIPVQSIGADVLKSTAVISAGTTQASQNINNAASFASKATTYMTAASGSLNDALTAVSELQDKLENYGSEVVNGYAAISDALTAMQENGGTLLTAIESGNVGDALASLTLFEQSAGSLNVAALPLQKDYVMRQVFTSSGK